MARRLESSSFLLDMYFMYYLFSWPVHPQLIRTFCLIATLFSCTAYGQDVVYLKDGTILKGDLILQDFSTGQYRLKVLGGSIFNLKQADIDRITQEKPLQPTQSQPDQGIAHSSDQRQHQAFTPSPHQRTERMPVNHVIGGLTGSQSVIYRTDDSFEYEYTFKTRGISYQYNFSKNLGLYNHYIFGNLVEVIQIGKNGEPDQTIHFRDDVPQGNRVKLQTLSSMALLSTNHYQGFQLYGGAGLAIIDIKNGSEYHREITNHKTIVAPVIAFGLGYAWRPVQLLLRYEGHSNASYGYKVSNSRHFSLQFGIHF